MDKRFILAMLLLLCTVPLVFAGTTGKFAGKVTDADSGEPLPGVNVIIEGTDLGAATDLEGDYYIINVPPGHYTLTASMMGYKTINKTDLLLSVDHTVTTNFIMEVTTMEGDEVTIVAERDVIAMDMSASRVSLASENVKEIPNATSIDEVIYLQVGVDFDPSTRGDYAPADIMVRGGGRGQNSFMVDGLMMVDNRSNRPMMMVNLSSIKEINIIKGGFNAEYGNVRSGLINVVTKEGSPDKYSGSFEFRYTPGQLKHSGESIFDPNNYFLRSFLDTTVCWTGTSRKEADGGWDDFTRESYPTFAGWDLAYRTLRRTYPDVTPEDARNLFIWQHRAEGVEDIVFDSLGTNTRKAGEYGDLPDWIGEASFGGPVPFLSKKLGNLRFFANHRINKELFALPTNRDYFIEQNSQLKLSADITPSLKVMVEGVYGEIHTVQAAPRATGLDAYMTSGVDILYSPIATSQDYGLGGNASLYYPAALNKFDIYRTMTGFAVDHVLSPNTFYNARMTLSHVQHSCPGPEGDEFRNDEIIGYIGALPVDETPFGYGVGIEVMAGDGMASTGEGATRDFSKVNTVNFRFDITSQVNKYNQVKAGLEFNYDDLDVHYEHNQIGDEGNNWTVQWRRFPFRGGLYLQDKLEFKGMIANVGLRMDYSNPNSKAYITERYSQYFRQRFMDVFETLAPSEDAKQQVKLAPRLGISHPISENAKLYFNYGHFYSVPTADELFIIMKRATGLTDIGNPNADLAKTVAYELGVEYSISDMFLLHLSGYYKDISDQLANIHYVGLDGGVDYWSRENNNYEDVRGLEARIEKRFGAWVTGWANYNYMVTTSGYIGRQTYYEDPRQMEQEGLMNPYQERPLARPIARANITISSPDDFGPEFSGIHPFAGIRTDLLFSWRAGRYETSDAYIFWTPLGDEQTLAPLQWKDRTSFDLRIRKNFMYKNFALNLYLDFQNVFNLKELQESGFSDANDRYNYMRSLHLSRYEGDEFASKEEYEDMGFFAGDDRPGDYRKSDVTYQPIEQVSVAADLKDPNSKVIYFDSSTRKFMNYVDGVWSEVSQSKMDQVLDDKAYINMPDRGFLTFFNPRAITFGIELTF